MKKTLFFACCALVALAISNLSKTLIASTTQLESAVFVSESKAINKVLMIEKLANDYQTQFEHSQKKSSNEDKLRRLLEAKGRSQIDTILEKVKDPQVLYTMAVLLNDGYGELYETMRERLLFFASEAVVCRLASLRGEMAYYYFIRLKQVYGTDGAGALEYRLLEFRHFKQYSKDPEVLRAKTEGEFI